MRIAYVYDAVYPWETGGIQKRVWEIARRLATDHDVHWYGLRYWDGPAVTTREGVTLHGVMEPPELYVDGRRSIPEALAYSARLVRPLLGSSFDVVDCQEFPYFPAFSTKLQSTLRRSVMVLTWHEVWGEYWTEYLGSKGVLGQAVERLATHLPDQHVAVSHRTRRELNGLGVENSAVVPNGISMAEVASVDPADGPVDLLYVGRLIPEKNVDLVVRTVAELRDENPDIECVLVGDGPEWDRIERLVAELGLENNVRMPGLLEEYEDVLGLMKAAEVFTLPSQREGFGICALEALACRTPVVTIEHSQNAAQELVTDGVTGAVCDPTPGALAAAVRRVRSEANPADCVAFARRYEWDRIAEQTERLYAQAVEG